MIKHKTILTQQRIEGSGFLSAVSATAKSLEPVLAEMAKGIDAGHSVVIRMNLIDKDGFIVGDQRDGEMSANSSKDENNVPVIEEGDEAIMIDLDEVEDPFESVGG